VTSVLSFTTVAKFKVDAVIGVEAIRIRCFDGCMDDIVQVLHSVGGSTLAVVATPVNAVSRAIEYFLGSKKAPESVGAVIG
jgi:hypothetical protein